MKKLTAFFALFSVLTVSYVFAAEPIRVACVGDSITAGHGIKEQSLKYPQQLGSMLGKDFAVRNFGVSGTVMLSKGDYPYIKASAYKKALEFNPNIVIIKLGSNDTKPHNWKFKNEFEHDMNAMIDAFSALESKPVIYLCYPAPIFSLESKYINEDRIFNGIIPMVRKVAAERKLKVIDFHSALTYKPEFFPDKLHPNAAGAKLMAEVAHSAILKGLDRK